ncbi:MAG: hypothetical protein NC337_01200 [Roseburia sp.]|nr:hypothetical protein [Roseburia sp.]
MKRVLSVLMVCALVVSMFVPVRAKAADNSVWVKKPGKQAWTYTDGQGTNLVASIDGDTLYIGGTGAVPSYDRDSLGNRPWHNRPIRALEFETGVTSIGAEAFSNLRDLYHVTIWSGTFIEDPSAFGGASQGCLFDIMGTNIVSRNIGNVPYNSLDSIAAFMQRYSGYYRYTLANYYMIKWVQNSVSPRIDFLLPQSVVSEYTNPNYPIIDYQSRLYFVSPQPEEGMLTYIQRKQQGMAAMEAFSLMLGDATYVTSYNMSITGAKGKGMVEHTDTPLTYMITIPAEFQYPGRQFFLLQIGNGVVNVLADEDWNDATLTFTTDYPSTVYALIYK